MRTKKQETEAPLLNPRFGTALLFASELHRGQTRKGGSVPYVAHLLGVAAIVLEAGGNEDQAIAALLHDALEDQGGLPTLDTIRRLFGARVADTVKECSDSESSDPAKKLPWAQRKQQYLAHLLTASPDALIVSAADKVHNARALVTDYRKIGDKLWERFSKEASEQDQLQYYRALVTALGQTSAPTGLIDELDKAVSELEQLVSLD